MTDRHQSAVADARRWPLPMSVLMASAALVAISPALHPVNTADGSTTAATVGTGWLAAVAVFVALAATLRSAELGIAAVAGAGAVATGRLLADLGLLLSPDAVLRPELFGVQNVAAFPLTATWAGTVPVVADLLAIIAAGIAGREVLDGYEPPTFGDDTPDQVRPFRATPFTFVGLVAVGLVIASSLGVLYASPVPVVRPLGVADIGLFGAAGAALGGLVLCLLVVVASVLPPVSARGLVIGAGAACAVPSLTVLLAGGDVRASGLAWIGLVGAVLLAAASLLSRQPVPPAEADPESPAAAGDLAVPAEVPAWRQVALGVLGLAAAGCAVLAYLRPQAASLLGTEGASFDAAGSAFLPAAIVLLVAGLAALAPATAEWGRLGLGLAWLPVTAALLNSLEFTSSSIWVSAAVFTSAGGVQRSTGAWWGVAAVVLAVIAAVAAPLLSARYREVSVAALDPAEDAAAESRRSILGWTLTAMTVVAYALPVFSANDRPSAALFVGGARVDSYGAWLSVLGLTTAIWLACRHRRRVAAIGLLLAAALVVACRIVLLPAVRHQLEFEVRPGFYVSAALVVALLAAPGVLWSTIGPPAAVPAASAPRSARTAATPGRSAPARAEAGKPAVTSPRGKRG